MITANNQIHIYNNTNIKQIPSLHEVAFNMITSGEISTPMEFFTKFMFLFDTEEQYPVNIEELIDMRIYDRKDNAKIKLINKFTLNRDFKIELSKGTGKNRVGGSGKKKEDINLTIDCFKHMCMNANNDIGKITRQYFIDLEKIFKTYIIMERNWYLTVAETTGQELSKYITRDRKLRLVVSNLIKQKKSFRKHKNILTKKISHYKFPKGDCFYILNNPDNKIKFKVGFSGNINNRLKMYRTSIPDIKIIYLVYLKEAKLLEEAILKKFSENRMPNHEILLVQSEKIIKSARYLLQKYDVRYVENNDICKYNKTSESYEKVKE